MALLSLQDLTVAYGPVVAVHSASLEVEDGAIVGVIGANGAGKSSLLRGVMGLSRPRGGRVIYDGDDVSGLTPYRMVRRGVAFVPQDRGTLAPLTVRENIELAASRTPKRERGQDFEQVHQLFPILYERREIRAGMLSGGEQQMLALARALLTRPKLLLLDEPSTGLAPIITAELMETIKSLPARRAVTVLVVEQNVAAVLDIADYAYLLDRGRIVDSGDATTLRQDPNVRRTFIGV